MRTEDFIMLRRKKVNIIEDEEGDYVLEHRQTPAENMNVERESLKNKKGRKWVRFLDVGISCPEDESDDELAFCKPEWTKKKKHESG